MTDKKDSITFPSGITLVQDPDDPYKFHCYKDDEKFDWTKHLGDAMESGLIKKN